MENDFIVSGIKTVYAKGRELVSGIKTVYAKARNFITPKAPDFVRDYQILALDDLFAAVETGSKRLYCGPPNCGKGYITDEAILRLVRQGKRVLVVVDKLHLAAERREKLLKHVSYIDHANPFRYGVFGAILALGLLTSCVWTASIAWLAPASIIAATVAGLWGKLYPKNCGYSIAASQVGLITGGEDFNPDASIQICTIQSLKKVAKFVNVDLVMVDEAHHYEAKVWKSILEALPGQPALVGFTATPHRADGVPLRNTYDSLYEIINYSGMRERGLSVPVRTLVPGADWRNKKRRHHLAVGVVDSYVAYGQDKPALVYVSNIATADLTVEQFVAAGYERRRVKAVHSQSEEKDAISAFNNGSVDILVNVHMLSEGLNLPRAEVCIIARGLQHKSTYRQVTGRVLRINPETGKIEAIIIDLCGVTFEHGPADADMDYNLNSEGLGEEADWEDWEPEDDDQNGSRATRTPFAHNEDLFEYTLELQREWDKIIPEDIRSRREWQQRNAVHEEFNF